MNILNTIKDITLIIAPIVSVILLIKYIGELRKLTLENQKIRLELEKLKKESEKENQIVLNATAEDIAKYVINPIIKAIESAERVQLEKAIEHRMSLYETPENTIEKVCISVNDLIDRQHKMMSDIFERLSDIEQERRAIDQEPLISIAKNLGSKDKDFDWVSAIRDPEIFSIASSVLAVRRACYQYLWRIQTRPKQSCSPNQSECHMYSEAVRKLRKRFINEFQFEPLNKDEGYSSSPSPAWLLTLCDNVLAFIKMKSL